MIEAIDGTLTVITTPGQSGPENNENEEVHHISQSLGQEPYYLMQFSIIRRTPYKMRPLNIVQRNSFNKNFR